MINSTLSHLHLQLLTSPFITRHIKFNIFQSSFQKFSAPLILNSFGKVENTLFKNALSQTIRINSLYFEPQIFTTEQQYTDVSDTDDLIFQNCAWKDCSSLNYALECGTENDICLTKTLNMTFCLFTNIGCNGVIKSYFPMINISYSCFSNIQAYNSILQISHPSTVKSCNQTLDYTSFFKCSIREDPSGATPSSNLNEFISASSFISHSNMSFSNCPSSLHLWRFSTAEAVQASFSQIFQLSLIANSTGALFSFDGTSSVTFSEVINCNFVKDSTSSYFISTNREVFFIWSYFIKNTFSNSSKLWKTLEAPDENTTYVFLAFCVFDFKEPSNPPPQLYDSCLFDDKNTIFTNSLDFLNSMECSAFVFTPTAEGFSFLGFDDSQLAGFIMCIVALTFIIVYSALLIHRVIKKKNTANEEVHEASESEQNLSLAQTTGFSVENYASQERFELSARPQNGEITSRSSRTTRTSRTSRTSRTTRTFKNDG